MNKNNYFLQARLVNIDHVELRLTKNFPHLDEDFSLFFHYGESAILIKRFAIDNNDDYLSLTFKLPFKYPFGERCYLESEKIGHILIDLSLVSSFKEFDELFNYEGDDLGSLYQKERTTFKVWAPLADAVSLIYEDLNHQESSIEMIREEKGVYSISLDGDYLNHYYGYQVSNFGHTFITYDPYGKMMSLDNKYSLIVDDKKVASMPKILLKDKISSLSEAIIYELHLQDFTLDKTTNIVNKGKYLGLIEENKKSKKGHPVGLDYLKYLGVTHLQLLPVLDYQGENNANPNKDYNWGYDPLTFFALEGRYSTCLDNAQARLIEFRHMVDVLHQNNLRVNLDLVYNHLYRHLETCYEKIVPSYYFRRDKNGLYANASGCGNDVKSERFMAQKMILDSIKYLFKTFDIDGVRLDLMGLLDIDTVLKMRDLIKKIKPEAIIYGEGWNMGEELKLEQKACSDNSEKMENIGFFNDAYRDIVKGGSFGDGLYKKGFGSGDSSYVLGFIYAYMASVTDYTFHHRYIFADQSVNYVECHDNHTLFDKLSLSNSEEDEETILKRIKLINALVILSYGVPFIHSGQEIGLSKCGLSNTYNVPKVNTFDYSLLDERFHMSEYLKEVISLRKNELSFLMERDPLKILKSLHYEVIDDCLLKINIIGDEIERDFDNLVMLINIKNETLYHDLGTYYQPLLLFEGSNEKIKKMSIKNLIVSPLSVNILWQKKEE